MRISDWSSDVCSSDLFRAFEDHGRTVTWERGIRPDRAVCAPASESSQHAATRARGAGALEARRGPRDGTRRVRHRTESVWRRMANIVQFENEIGRAHVLTAVTNAVLLCGLFTDKNN